MKKRIKIGVGGRFHASHLAKALLAKGWDVSLVTSLPKGRIPEVPKHLIESHLTPELIFRILQRTPFSSTGAVRKMESFGRKFSDACRKEDRLDMILSWSGFAVEAFRENARAFKVLIRDSCHILEQTKVLQREYQELNLQFPDHRKIIARELLEYELADKIIVPSNLAKDTFIENGFRGSKIEVIRLGADLDVFKPLLEKKRTQGPLRVIYFGTVGIRKGTHYLLKAIAPFSPRQVKLTCVGSIEPELKGLVKSNPNVRFISPLPHEKLSKFLKHFDVFVFPSLEDGFGLVVPQAMAAGVVPVVSTAAGASELIRHGENGYLIPPGETQPIVSVLQELLKNPSQLAEVRARMLGESTKLSWNEYEKRFDQLLSNYLN